MELSTFNVETPRQINLNLRFVLRSPKSKKLTNIYGSVWMGGKGYKIPTGTKVKPVQWNSEHQVAIISNLQSKVDNHNNKIANDKLEDLKIRFSKYLAYLCETNVNYSIEKLTEYLGNMKQTITATDLIVKAFNYLHPEPKVVVGRVDTRRVYLSRLNSFTDYLRKKKITRLDVFTQAGLNAYTRYLTDKGESIGAINFKCELIVRLVNKVISVDEPFLKYKVHGGLVYNKKKDNRKDKGRFSLTAEEVEAIGNVKIDTNIKYSYSELVDFNIQKVKGKVLEEYRDIFCLQCHIGQRSSDMVQLLEYVVGADLSKVKRVQAEGQAYLEIKTKKSKYKEAALIYVDDYLESFIAKYRGGFELNINELDNGRLYNYGIRLLAKMAGIDRPITYRDSKDNELTEPAYLKISSHCARHTFITNKLREGISPDKLIYTTGHSSDEMIRRIYSHLTSTDKAKMVTEEFKKVGGLKKTTHTPNINTVQPKQHETMNVDYDRLLGRIERSKGRLGDVAKWLIDNDISIDALIGYYQKLNPDSINKVGDIVVRADMMMSRLLTIRDIIQES